MTRSLASPLTIALAAAAVATLVPTTIRAETRPLTFLLAADLDGALATPACRDEQPPPPTLARLAASLARARAGAEADGRQVVSSFYLGDFAGPAALGRFAMDSEGGPERLAALFARTGFTHLVLGNSLLDQPQQALAAYLPALRRHGVTTLNANLRCENRDDCAALTGLRPADRVVLPDGFEVEFVGAVPDATLATIDPAQRAGLSVTPLVTAVQTRAAVARSEGVRLVVLAAHLAGGRDALASAVTTAKGLDDVDLFLANHFGDAPQAPTVLQPPGAPALAGVGARGDEVVRLDVDVTDVNGRARLVRLSVERIVAPDWDEALASDVFDLIEAYCVAWDRPLATGTEGIVHGRGFLSYVLDLMRVAASAEVAAVNEGIADLTPFPLTTPFSRADVFVALPFDDQIVRSEVTGARLRALWNRAGPKSGLRQRLIFEGIVERDGTVYVNDRPLDDASKYTLALPDYVARGGDDLIGEKLEFKPVVQGIEPVRVRELTLASLASPSAAEALVNGPALDLSNEWRWTWSGATTLSALDTRFLNASEYPDESRLTRTAATTIRGDVTGRVDADTRDHALRLTGRGVYASTSVQGGTQASETEDQAFAEALYRLRSVRAAYDNAWYAPVPYLSTRVDTEFVENPTSPFRHFEVGTTVGVRLQPIQPLEVKIGGGIRREVFDPNGRWRWGVEFGYELPRFSPIKLFQTLPLDVESNLDWFVSDIGGEDRHEARLRARVLLPLGGPLAVSAGFDLLAIKRGAQPLALGSDITVGLTARLDGAAQTF